MPDHLNYKREMDVFSYDLKIKFTIDVICGRDPFSLRGTNQLRLGSLVLLRLDYNGKAHRNPDLKLVSCNHLHQYKEGYGVSWAISPPSCAFREFDDPRRTLHEFLKYCDVVEILTIR